MIYRAIIVFLFLLVAVSCYEPERDCNRFRTGTFTFTGIIDGQEQTTTFTRMDSIEIDFFQGRQDTSKVRWINDCEYIVEPLNPQNSEAAASLHMKILSTTENSYIFEYSLVGSSKKSKGTAIKTN